MADRENVLEIVRGISRHINCFEEQNRMTRKKAIEGVHKEILGKNPEIEPAVLQAVLVEILKPLLRLVSDPVEKCRELAITFIDICVQKIPQPCLVLPIVIPVLVQRLGQQEIVETSEEIRLQLVEFLLNIVSLTKKEMAPYVDDVVRISQRTIVDPYPEVKKQSCKCVAKLARSTPEHFHMVSENLIQPLTTAISHQHARVRVEVIVAIGDVLQYGNGKSVDQVTSHLAQRLFDQSPLVRSAVIQVVGCWLLDLMDRYSFFPKLLPLLLTGLTDEVPDIRDQADALWHDVGLKYQLENEKDLKDKQDFTKPDPNHYPPGIERPNLGCRTLMYHNFSKIVTGISNDITDWVVDTRRKSAKLLYTLLLNEEDNVTQHVDKVFQCLYKGCMDDEQDVVEYVKKSAELLGYFVSAEVWVKMLLQNLKMSQSVGSLLVLAAVIQGSHRSRLKPHLEDICSVLNDPVICRIADTRIQEQVLSCVGSIIAVCQTDCVDVSLSLFSVVQSVLALHRTDEVCRQSQHLLHCLALANNFEGVQMLYEAHTRSLIASLQEDYSQWTKHSVERLIFDMLLMECGPVVGEILEDVIPMMVANLDPEKDPEVRLKFFSLLSRLMLNSGKTLDSQNRFGDFAVTVVKDMIIPNCVWRAGRVATAIRTTAVSCLWALLKSEVLTSDRLMEIVEDVVTQLRSTLEDGETSTRLVSCRVLTKIFVTVGTNLDHDRLHNMYPDLLKRLDDGNDDVRIAMCGTFSEYFRCFGDRYEVGLYRAHLEALYKGLLVHMDDADVKIQESVLDVMKQAALLAPDMLLKEIDLVKHKHRSTKYCNALQEYVHKLPKPE